MGRQLHMNCAGGGILGDYSVTTAIVETKVSVGANRARMAEFEMWADSASEAEIGLARNLHTMCTGKKQLLVAGRSEVRGETSQKLEVRLQNAEVEASCGHESS